MYRRILFAMALVLSLPMVASAAPTIIAGEHTLEAGTPNQVVPIMVSGIAGDAFLGVDLYLTVGNGTDGPIITSLNLTGPGTVFAGNNNGVTDFGPPFQAPGREVVGLTTTQSGSVGPNGVLAFVQFDTTGIAPGEYSFSLTSPIFGGSDLPPFAVPTTILVDGTLTVVPEPSSVVLGLFAAAGVALALRRRSRRTA